MLWAHTSTLSEMIQSCRYLPHMSEMPSLTHTQTIRVIIILIIIHSIVNRHDTEVVICIILVILMRAGGFKHCLNIRQYTRLLQRYNSDAIVNFEPKSNLHKLKYTKDKCSSNYIFLKRFEVPLVLIAMIQILFQMCVFIEIVKLFHYKHLKIISHY